jgi:hypothetical protein
MGGPPAPHVKKQFVMKHYVELRNWTDSLERYKQRKMRMTFGRWNVRSLYKAGSLTTVARETAKYVLFGVQKVKWNKGGIEPSGDFKYFYASGVILLWRRFMRIGYRLLSFLCFCFYINLLSDVQ